MVAVTGCASGGQLSLRDGLLRADIGQKAFLSQWGPPDQTLPLVSAEMLAQRWGIPVNLNLLKVEDDELFSFWIYERYGTELLFQDGDLMACKMNRTGVELKAIPVGNPEELARTQQLPRTWRPGGPERTSLTRRSALKGGAYARASSRPK